MIDEIILRRELKSDRKAVEQVIYRAFRDAPPTGAADDGMEALLAHKLRASPAFMPQLDYVAIYKGAIIGSIMYTRSKIVGGSDSGERDSGECDCSECGGVSVNADYSVVGGVGGSDKSCGEWETLTFGPVAVLPKYQRQGVGGALIRKTLGIARELGYRAVLIYGHESYYPRFGFKPASEYGVMTADGANFPAFMALPLYDGALDEVHGRLIVTDAFSNLDRAESDAFNDKLAEPYDVDEYIGAQPYEVQLVLKQVRETIKAAAPDAYEKIAWQMPTYWQGGNLIHFAAQKRHVGIYPMPEAIIQFAPRLAQYKTSKGAIQFPYKGFGDEQLALISDMTAWRINTGAL